MKNAAAYIFGSEAITAAGRAHKKAVALHGSPKKFKSGFIRAACRKTGDMNSATPIYLDHLIEVSSARSLMEVRINGKWRPLIVDDGDGPCALADIGGLIEDHLDEKYNPPCRPSTTWLPFNYRLVPAWARLVIHHMLVTQRKIRYPRIQEGLWPMWNLQSLLTQCFTSLGVKAGRAPSDRRFVVTHDVDGPEQAPFAVEVAKIDRDAGIPSAFYLPGLVLQKCAKQVEAIAAMGHEIGFHGLVHDCRHLLMAPETYAEKIRKFMSVIQNFKIGGYRAPALLTNSRFRRELASIFLYDSSVPDTDIFAEAGLHRGCGMLEPYPESGLTVIPVTLPLDDRLLTLGCKDRVDLWLEKSGSIFEQGGLPVLCTHANAQYYRDGYRPVLARILRGLENIGGVQFVLPRDVAGNMPR